MDVLAKRLKWLREKERYSQKEIAAKINMTASGLQKIEYGDRDPNLDVLVKLCDIYGVSADFLLGRHNKTRELEELSEQIDYYNFQISTLQEEHTRILVRQHSIRDELEEINEVLSELEKQEGGVIKDEAVKEALKMKDRMLYAAVDRKVEVEAQLQAYTEMRSDVLNEYITLLLELPDSKPYLDKTLKEYLPLEIEIQPDIFDHFALHLAGRGVGFIGHYGDYETIEEAEENKKRLTKLLNGNRK